MSDQEYSAEDLGQIARADRAFRQRLDQITDPRLRAECLRAYGATPARVVADRLYLVSQREGHSAIARAYRDRDMADRDASTMREAGFTVHLVEAPTAREAIARVSVH